MLLILGVAASSGTLALGPRPGLAFRCAVGMGLLGQVFFALAWLGALNAQTSMGVVALAGLGGYRRGLRLAFSWRALGYLLATTPLMLLALHPPLAFDETLYHLPFVREFAAAGGLVYLPGLRFPVFPTLHETLCVPIYLLAGDTATHLVSLAQTLITVALVVEWAGRHSPRAGWLAAALVVGSPDILELSLINYVDAALTLFLTAAFYSLDRSRPGLAGFFLGTAFGVKYLAAYFIVVAVLMGASWRPRLLLTSAAAALPTVAWLVTTTGNPLFPYLTGVFGSNEWFVTGPPVTGMERVVRFFRVLYDVSFACHRVNHQAPMTPFLIPMVALLLSRIGQPRCRALLAVGLPYLVIFTFLPQDSRYLVPLLPVTCVLAAQQLPAPKTWWLVLAVLPGPLYLAVRLHRDGLPPITAHARQLREESVRPALVALRKAGAARVYCLRGEELQGLAPGVLRGDWFGPFSFDRIRGNCQDTRSLGGRLRVLGFDYLLVSAGAWQPVVENGGLHRVYSDDAAQLWKVDP